LTRILKGRKSICYSYLLQILVLFEINLTIFNIPLFTKSWFISALSIFLGFTLLWVAGFFYLLGQSSTLIFHPERSNNQTIPLKYDQTFARDATGENLDFWRLSNQRSQEFILYLHGNSGRIPGYFTELIKNYSALI